MRQVTLRALCGCYPSVSPSVTVKATPNLLCYNGTKDNNNFSKLLSLAGKVTPGLLRGCYSSTSQCKKKKTTGFVFMWRPKKKKNQFLISPSRTKKQKTSSLGECSATTTQAYRPESQFKLINKIVIIFLQRQQKRNI